MKTVVICEICGERIATVEIDRLTYPLSGAMFESVDPEHQVPSPFDAGQEWETFRCPYGRTHRPMFKDNEILTPAGLIVIPKDGSPPFLTEALKENGREAICDRSFTFSEEEAAQQVRKEYYGETEVRAGKQENNQSVEEEKEETEQVAEPQKRRRKRVKE